MECQIHLRKRTVEPSDIFDQVAAFAFGVFPVDQVRGFIIFDSRILLPVARRIGGNSGGDHEIHNLLAGTEFRSIDITLNSGSVEKGTERTAFGGRPVQLGDHVIHIGHHPDAGGNDDHLFG